MAPQMTNDSPPEGRFSALREAAEALGARARRWAYRTYYAVKDEYDAGEQVVTAGLLAACGLLLLFGLYWTVLVFQVPNVSRLKETGLAEATIAYTADGQELTRYAIENRTWVGLDSIAKPVVSALIATEDRRFYRHSGIDVPRLFGAVIGTARGDWQGGSTLTMQVARNIYPAIRDDFVISRKFKEWLTALRLEDNFTKDEILELYLNAVPFMYGAVGIESGAQTYFRKPARALGLLESATLVGMLKATAYYNPVRHPERSQERRNVVLGQMVKYGYLSQADYARVRDQPTEVRFRRLTRHDNTAPYFAEQVRQQLDVWADKNGYNLYTGGLRVYTTLDAGLQAAAEKAVAETGDQLQAIADVEWSAEPLFSATTAQPYVDRRGAVEPFAYFWERNTPLLVRLVKNSGLYRDMVRQGAPADTALARLGADPAFLDSLRSAYDRLEVGFIAIDPRTSHIKAWVGGRDFRYDEYDHVSLAKRQPGSTFKPFVYAAALENGYSPYSVVSDAFVNYVDPQTGQRWNPKNFGGSSGGYVSLRNGLAFSKNTVTARLITDIGADKVVSVARRAGIDSRLQAVPSLGLGTSEVSLKELAEAYTAFGSLGQNREPLFITRIEDREGNVIARFGSRLRKAMEPHIAYAVLDMMRGVVEYGTGVRLRTLFGAQGDLAGKTGTTQNAADGWFMLLHPTLTMGAWVGFNNPAVTFRSVYWGQGAHTALHVVGEFYREVRRSKSEALDPSATFAAAPNYRWGYRAAADPDTLTRREREENNLGEILERIRESRGEAADQEEPAEAPAAPAPAPSEPQP